MTSNRRYLPLLAAIALAGCVSRAEMDAVKQQLATCETDKQAAQKGSGDCEARLQTESKRWDAIESQLTSQLPATLKSFEDERTRIIQIVPEQVRSEVGKRLDRYFVNVSREFEKMDAKVDTLRDELRASNRELAELSKTARSVESKLDNTHQAVLVEQGRADEHQRRVSEVIATIAEFDRDKINCDKCKDKVKVKGKSKEQLLAFHSGLIEKVQGLNVAVARK